MPKRNSGFAPILILGLVVVAGVVLFLISKNFGVKNLNLNIPYSSPNIITSNQLLDKNGKTYTNEELGFSINISSDLILLSEGLDQNYTGNKTWTYSWSNYQKEEGQNLFKTSASENTAPYDAVYKRLDITITKDPEICVAGTFSCTKSEPLNNENIKSYIKDRTNLDTIQFAENTAIKNETEIVVGDLNKRGVIIEYYIFDEKDNREVRLEFASYNKDEYSIEKLKQILSTFRFLK